MDPRFLQFVRHLSLAGMGMVGPFLADGCGANLWIYSEWCFDV